METGGSKVAREIIVLASFDSPNGQDIGEQRITAPLDGENPRAVAKQLYTYQRIIDKISVPRHGNEITVVFA